MRSLSVPINALLGCALLMSLTVVGAHAGGGHSTWYVDDDGLGSTGSCQGSSLSLAMTIQDAIDSANPGDTIMVCPGTYDEVISVTTSHLSIRSVKKWKAIITPPADFTPATNLFTISDATGVVVRHFRFLVPTTGDCPIVDTLIHVDEAPLTKIRGNKMGISGGVGLGDCGYAAGVHVVGTSDGVNVSRNRITDFRNQGIIFHASGDVIVRYNRISFYHAAYASVPNGSLGIYVALLTGDASVMNNRVRSLDSAGTSTPRLSQAITAVGHDSFRIRGNIAKNVRLFIYLIGGSDGAVNWNRATLNIQNGMTVSQSTGLSVTRNVISASEKGIDVDSFASDNRFRNNDWGSAAAANDCNDASSGGGTANTANTWKNNTGATSNPPGICAPAP